MKKNQLITVLSVLGISFALGLSTTSVHADSTGTTADSTGTTSVGKFTVNPGSLSIDSVPDFNFGSTSVKDLTTGTTLNYQSGSNNKLTVSDYRGASNPDWTLGASLSDFTSTSGNRKVAGSINLATDTKAAGTISKTGGKVWDNVDAETNGAGDASATVSTDTKLVTEANSAVDGGNYTSTITWTMTNTAASAK